MSSSLTSPNTDTAFETFSVIFVFNLHKLRCCLCLQHQQTQVLSLSSTSTNSGAVFCLQQLQTQVLPFSSTFPNTGTPFVFRIFKQVMLLSLISPKRRHCLCLRHTQNRGTGDSLSSTSPNTDMPFSSVPPKRRYFICFQHP